MNSSKATCTVTARCATLTHTSGRTSTTLTTITSTHTAILLALALAGAIGFAGNWLAALVRSRAGRRLESPALIADGDHARIDAYVSLAVIASAIAAGAECASAKRFGKGARAESQ